MTSMTIVSRSDIAGSRLTASGVRSGADSGDPQVSLLTLAAEAGGNIGIWECEPGGWPVVDRPDTEVAYIISGRATLSDDESGSQVEVTAGDVIILPPGWSGRWDVRETVRKVFAIY